ncbi:arsenic resistance protein [Microbacterium sorbitolivorans]|uniref:Arsenic resistance protein n=1 Tax=Microbacterium sorbitolivorans TaxID=1867410 RepID=A0A367Y9B9_9MICO|nr:arsenic resistance protein [Microbacterium sorbitolivorans]RCK61632.1 arsenic resistance protein [Microbacterium sorbitolivorans]GGF30513.1 arsenic resistance protein [Microbacterium sorbitolivorans]
MNWLERHQVAMYLGALAAGAAAGLLSPAIADPAGHAVSPALALLLYVTFLGVPFARIRSSLRDSRFLVTLGVLNFVVVPPIAWLLSRVVADDQALLAGVLFVLLAPCVDYVIVFAGLAGGSADRLLAAAPLLLLAQMVALPAYLRVFMGSEIASAIEPAPFVEALVVLIVVPMALAAATQFLASRAAWARAFERRALGMMVPLMMLTLAAVVASQIAGVGAHLHALPRAIAVYSAFALVMVPVGILLGRAARTDPAGRRAIVFSGVTRNSLVVLPLVIALPAGFELAPLAVVTQTLVELVAMVVMVRAVPRLVR